ncbi:NCS2 family permease [Nitrospina watsonii]|uniref:Xanthine/uracil/thiamine/ascorbate permease family protein n=1 Tax=Nitrospina watsonii TaxID=1323948 RepID=A0ABM9HF61_9BACT|nr:NCS2 family permease [Nitrospina watsonii]CAI2718898.1 Xanthine/uracil/thiamine/ascorbate permease family protein [Nitrospina watsonii]
MTSVLAFLDRFFRVREQGSTPLTEMRAGLVTFMTASYIIFVQPAVMAQAGMDFGAVMTATCLAAALGCLIMGLYANYPIALAPGMGINFYFTYSVVLGQGIPWQIALGAVFLSGIGLILLTVCRFREVIVNSLPNDIKVGISVGIGLFIAFIGFVQGGIVMGDRSTLVQLAPLNSLPALFTIAGVGLIGVLLQRKIKGAILIGMVTMALAGMPFGLVQFHGVVALPPDITPTLLQLDILGALDLGLLTVAGVFLFVDLFDTAGTLVGIGHQGGFLKDGRLPRAYRALWPDSVATTAGSVLGTTTVTCYIESAAGVAEGGRTGLASVVTALMFLLALFLAPLAKMFGGGYAVDHDTILYPITAPVLIIVGAMMAANVTRIQWQEWDEALPAFLILIGMPLTYSIADGMALGFILYPVIKVLVGKARQVHWIMYVIATLFLLRYLTV